jgi:hypothetical protein
MARFLITVFWGGIELPDNASPIFFDTSAA